MIMGKHSGRMSALLKFVRYQQRANTRIEASLKKVSLLLQSLVPAGCITEGCYSCFIGTGERLTTFEGWLNGLIHDRSIKMIFWKSKEPEYKERYGWADLNDIEWHMAGLKKAWADHLQVNVLPVPDTITNDGTYYQIVVTFEI